MTDLANANPHGYQWLEGTMKQVTPEVAHWLPAGKPGSIGAQYAHVALTEDYFIHGLLQAKSPLMAGAYAGQLGKTQLPPSRSNWGEWGRVIQGDLEQLRAYAHAVYSAKEAYLASIIDETLQLPIDATKAGMGMQTAVSLLNMLLANAHKHCGEIAALKGLQGLKRHPV